MLIVKTNQWEMNNMADNSYFNKFPIINYNGYNAISLLRRVDFNKYIKNYITAFHPYTLNENDNIDNLSYHYYEDVDLDWLIYHTNDLIDPYYDVPLKNENFEQYIIKKYGTIRNAQRKIIHYKTNYESDDQLLSTSGYTALDSDRKKYWNPIISVNGIIGYERANKDIIISTNKIESFTYATELNEALNVGEIIYKQNEQSNTYAEVTWSNTSYCMIKHVIGDFSSNNNYTCLSETSNQTFTVNAESVSTITNVIPLDEVVYFSPVRCYDYEFELNENKRDLYLVDNTQTNILNKQLSELME